jgi:hypothetical protein
MAWAPGKTEQSSIDSLKGLQNGSKQRKVPKRDSAKGGEVKEPFDAHLSKVPGGRKNLLFSQDTLCLPCGTEIGSQLATPIALRIILPASEKVVVQVPLVFFL